MVTDSANKNAEERFNLFSVATYLPKRYNNYPPKTNMWNLKMMVFFIGISSFLGVIF